MFSYFLKDKVRSGAEGIGHAKAMRCIMNCGVTAETTIDVGWVLNNSWLTIRPYLFTTKIYISLVIITWFLVLFVVVGFSAVLNLTHHTVSSSGDLGVLLPERDFRCRDTDWVCSFTAFTTTRFLSYVSCSLTVFCLHVQRTCLGHGYIWVFFYFYLL